MAEYDRDSENRPIGDSVVHEALGHSEAFLSFQERLSRVAQVDRPVLLIGERGTGKELAAARVHYLSPRWKEPFVALNCAALASSLIEAELFGHEEGAFTGASRRRTGRFEAANDGTLFLDEIGNIPVETQEKILRVVEYGSFERVGSSRPIQVDARIIGATNANLSEMADQGYFMRDLLDRLSFEVLFLPPLRERREDIMLLAQHFGSRMAYELKWEGIPEFTPKAVKVLEGYDWPGNVRELKNVVERAVYRSDDNIIEDAEIIFDPFQSPYEHRTSPRRPVETPVAEAPHTVPIPSEPAAPDLSTVLDGMKYNDAITSVELCLLKCALDDAKYNQRKAAETMGLTYHQFRGLYRKHQDKLDQ
ncbi:MAG: phage shock protein operon transcriptional activator [Candidatus Hydrogenedentes bacterium]|nr:phage shock protein operon transcriptional activator [Candidatus Hydrogenedentota bacterium]